MSLQLEHTIFRSAWRSQLSLLCDITARSCLRVLRSSNIVLGMRQPRRQSKCYTMGSVGEPFVCRQDGCMFDFGELSTGVVYNYWKNSDKAPIKVRFLPRQPLYAIQNPLPPSISSPLHHMYAIHRSSPLLQSQQHVETRCLSASHHTLLNKHITLQCSPIQRRIILPRGFNDKLGEHQTSSLAPRAIPDQRVRHKRSLRCIHARDCHYPRLSNLALLDIYVAAYLEDT